MDLLAYFIVQASRGVSRKTFDSFTVKQKLDYFKLFPTSSYKPKVKDWVAKLTARSFMTLLKKAKLSQLPLARWCVSLDHDFNYYSKGTTWGTKGGSTFSIVDKDIVSLCRNRNDPYRGRDLVKLAVTKGGRKLDAYGILYDLYTSCGFQPVCMVRFNKQYAPNDWCEDYGEPPIIFYKYNPKYKPVPYRDWVDQAVVLNDYDEAYTYRDRSMK